MATTLDTTIENEKYTFLTEQALLCTRLRVLKKMLCDAKVRRADEAEKKGEVY